MRKDMTLADIKKSIPQGGLLNPGLRTISTNVKKIRPMKTPGCGHFKNVLGR